MEEWNGMETTPEWNRNEWNGSGLDNGMDGMEWNGRKTVSRALAAARAGD